MSSPENKIGRYIIEEELGRGGMGRVYKAFDDRFERHVAVKVMPDAVAREESFRTRFEREAKIIAALQHPGIVPVHDFGEDNGQLFLVMRYMPGGSLRDRINQGPISIQEIAKIMHNVCHALQSAHQQNIVHRDLKPGNILFDQYGHAFLADFGIARLTNAATRLTETHAIIGTAEYMSPEQVRSDQAVDHRSDIYSLGIILFEMLAGTWPYKAETPSKTMMMHVLEPVPSILDIRPEFPYRCEQILQVALAKERMDRYHSAVEMAQEVRQMAQNARRRGRTGPLRPQQAPRTHLQPPTTQDGRTIDENYLRQQAPSSGNDLIDDVLSYYSKSDQERLEERAEQMRQAKRREEAAKEARRKKQQEEARRQAAEQAAQARKQQQDLITLAVGAAVIILTIIVLIVLIFL